MKLSRKVTSIAITSAAALTLSVSAQTAHADTYNGSEITGHWTDAHGVAGYHVAGQADLVNNGGVWYQNGQEISVDGIIPGYHATEPVPVNPTTPSTPAPSTPKPAPVEQPTAPQPVQQPATQQPAVEQPAVESSTPTPSTPTPSKPKADLPTTQPNQHVEANPTDETHGLHQTATEHSVQQLESTPDDTSKTIYPAQEGQAHAAANPNYSNAKYSDTHSVLPQTGVANTIGLVAMGVAAICSALSAALLLNRDRNRLRK